MVLDNETRVSWDHPDNLVSWETEELIDRIKAGVVIPLFFLLGTPANVLNMVVFYRHGLKERINVCLFSLALVDLLHLTPVFVFHVEQVYSQFTDQERYGPSYRFMMNNNLLGFYGFGYGSMLLSAVVSTERCVCVLFPFTARRCLPTKVFAVCVLLAVLTVSLLRFVVTAQFQVVCFHEVRSGRTSWQAVVNDYFFENFAMLSVLDGVFYGFCLSVGCPAVVLLTTVITAVRLWQMVRWRTNTSSGMSSPKEMGVTRMLISLSAEFLVLSIPLIALRVTRLFPSVLDPFFHTNMFRLLLNCSEISFYVSSSVNFVVYYTTGTRYRETLHDLLGVRKVGEKKERKAGVASSRDVSVSAGGSVHSE
ncbi:uncharacterized protein LOC143298330 [Babylonia areolata]|uniref:uncharacterized protein LOC143298330 n=1 Tax=Babylonia areolata TaxID=304850 RepID=UPI003FD1436E